MNVANETARAAFFLAFVYKSGGIQRQTDHTGSEASGHTLLKLCDNTINNSIIFSIKHHIKRFPL